MDADQYQFHHKILNRAEAIEYIKNYQVDARRPIDRHTLMLKYIPENSKVLDYGCGWGVFSRMVAEKKCTVVGIDRDESSIKIAKEVTGEKPGLSFAVKEISEFPDESFDVVVSNQVIEHVHNPGNYLKECNRVLRKGGIFLIATPNILTPQFFMYQFSKNQKLWFKQLSEKIRNNYAKTNDHIMGWDPHSFCRLLSSVGFDYEDHEYIEGVPFPGAKYWNTRLSRIKNFSYVMCFVMKKNSFVDVGIND